MDLRSELGLLENDIAMVMSSRTVKHKGHQLVIEALAILREKHQNLHIFFIGDKEGTWYQELNTIVAQLEVIPYVHFLGYKDNVEEIIAAMDIYVQPSYIEALSMSLLEACSVGLCCVAANVGGMPEVVENGTNGLLFDLGDSNDLAKKIAYLIENPEIRAEFASKAIEIHQNKFLDEVMASKTKKVYENAMLEFGGGI